MKTTATIISLLWLAGSANSAAAQPAPELQTTGEANVYAGPNNSSAVVGTMSAHQQIIIIPPKSVIIGKGVTIGQGVLIEGKPWHQIQLPDGQTGYLSGSLICSPSSNVVGTAGLCSSQ